MTELPSSWTYIPLGETGSWRGGGTPSKDVPEFWVNGEVPWVSPKDMKTARIRDSEDHITDLAVDQSATKRVPEGSVLIVTRSGILAHTLPVAVTDVEVTVNQDLKAITPSDSIEVDFMAWALRAFGHDILEKCKKDGTTVASIEFEALSRYQMPLAPYKEQLRIVDAIDSYVTRLDNAVASLERVQTKLRAYRASVLKAAVAGRLVPTEASLAQAERRDYESAEALLTRILKERRRHWEETALAKLEAAGKAPKDDKWKGNYEEPPSTDASVLPELPEGWCWARLGALMTIRSGFAFKSDDYQSSSDGVVLVRQSELRGRRVSVAKAKRVPRNFWTEYGTRFGIKKGDILVGLSGSLSSVSVYEESEPALQNQRTGLLEPSPLVPGGFLLQTYLSVAEQIEKAGKGIAVQNVAPSDIEKFCVPLPPFGEQVRISEEVERLLSLCEDAYTSVSGDLIRCGRLRQAVLKWAFEGKLVGQDPTDEPADSLLARIRTHRAAAPAQKSRGRTPKEAA